MHKIAGRESRNKAGRREREQEEIFVFICRFRLYVRSSVLPVLFSEEKRSSNKLKEIENKVVDDVYARADELSFKITK